MQRVVLMLALVSAAAVAEQSQTNPLAAVISLLEDLALKVTADKDTEAKTFAEFTENCKTSQTNLVQEIETSSLAIEKLTASIADSSSSVEVSDSKVGDIASSIATSEAELKDATAVRAKETEDFSATEKELMETISTLDRAGIVLSREMAKNPASFAQIDTKNMAGLLQSLSVMVDAAGLSSKDQSNLVALVQAHQGEDADDEEFGAPAAAAYKSHSANIVDVIMDLKDKAEAELAALRKTEMSAKHSFDMMKQSLVDQIAADTKELSEEKAAKAAAAEEKASAEGELSVTSKDLAQAKESLEASKSDCATKAADHEASAADAAAELKTIAEATAILKETTSGAVSQTYSFLQVQTQSRLHSRADLANSEVVALVRKVAREQHSTALAQLASRIAAIIRYGHRNGADPFSKVKELISSLIMKLQKEAGEEASEKAFCDEETKNTETKKEELQDVIAKLSVELDKASSKSTALKEDVKELQAELAELQRTGGEMQKIRSTESTNYKQAKADLTTGLEGVRKALSVLKEYYESDSAAAFLQKSAGAGGSIIDILETVEADFSKDLAEKDAAESDAVAAYEKDVQEMKITQATKEQDVKYKTGEFKALDKSIAELSSDKDTSDTELSAVFEYEAKIKERCVKKPESYASRKERRAAEIKGLKEALAILDGQAAFLQRRRNMRGVRAVGQLQ